ncbi:class D sortase [Evansella cellulosilytica]|uniref:Sortase family protein n=1 Tax=Evansella cellulosilytica (strain ATCC 21833 / DSM 2522 / FERM P-1141 / JCM 9156 / N-4) TaxID=649639 RepID=E6TSC6_EVAC2|nr:class D sortase [Evansella cellulosilytica]ADU31895.1 sortase family protein [Evansella cellulosilytica DSM 2522]
MKKLIGIVFILAGLIFVGTAGYQIYQTNAAQKDALDSAREIVNRSTDERKNLTEPVEFEPDHGETIGILYIPKLDAELPIVAGTDEDDLDRGVGHFTGTGFPTQERQILLSGHRDTVFRNLGDLEIGDIFEVQMEYGTFQYEIEETFIVDADDRTVIDYSIDEEVLTVSTCYPFGFIGNAPDRYILNAKPVN